jgi:glycosyltransferase involved in cell wall biosynthesis
MTSALQSREIAGVDLAGIDVRIVHDYLNQRGGAERVVMDLAELWPQAPIYTSLFRKSSTYPGFGAHDVKTSFLNRLPVDRGFRNLFPLYPMAFRSFGPIDADVVIASSSGWSHMVRTTDRTLQAVYCHTPARWLYHQAHLSVGRASARQSAVTRARAAYCGLDRRAALRADLYIANSQTVRARIQACYGIDAPVIYPPVDVGRFRPSPRGERLLVVSRMLPYKRVDVIVRVAGRLGIGLDVVGTGPQLAELQAQAAPNVEFHGSVDEASLISLMEGCRAVCVMGEEDFGIVAVEAQAAGKPVIALGRGGSLESVVDGWSGSLFDEGSDEAVASAIRACDDIDTPHQLIAERVGDLFSRETFEAELSRVLSLSLERKHSTSRVGSSQPASRLRAVPTY